MAERIDYQIEKYRFTEINESPRLVHQWAHVVRNSWGVRRGDALRY